MKMRRVFVLAGLAVGLALVPGSPVAAHVLRVDNGVNLEMHIPPADTPLAGEQTRLEFRFIRGSASLLLADYTLTASVKSGNQLVARQVLQALPQNTHGGSVTVQFPRPAVYSVEVTGRPVTAAAASFDVSYTVRVAGTAAQHTASRTAVLLPLAGAGIIMLIIAIRLVSARSGKQVASDIRRPRNK